MRKRLGRQSPASRRLFLSIHGVWVPLSEGPTQSRNRDIFSCSGGDSIIQRRFPLARILILSVSISQPF